MMSVLYKQLNNYIKYISYSQLNKTFITKIKEKLFYVEVDESRLNLLGANFESSIVS